MGKRYPELPAASALDGSEVVAVWQGNELRRSTGSAVAALGGGSSLAEIEIDATGAWSTAWVLRVVAPAGIQIPTGFLTPAGGCVDAFDLGSQTAVTALDLPDLAQTVGVFRVASWTSLASLSAAVLQAVGGELDLSGNSGLPALSLPALASIGTTLRLWSNDALASISLPAIQRIGGDISSNGLPALESLTLGDGLLYLAGDVGMPDSILTEASVDSILARLAALDGTAGTVEWGAGRTVQLQGGASPPSAAGLLSVATLEGRGATVMVNS